MNADVEKAVEALGTRFISTSDGAREVRVVAKALRDKDAEIERLRGYIAEADRRVGAQFMAAQTANAKSLRRLNSCGEAHSARRAAESQAEQAEALLRDVLGDNQHVGHTTPETLNRITAHLGGRQMSKKSPMRAVVMIAKIDADNRHELATHLQNLAIDIERGEHYQTSISGGCSSGHILHLTENDNPTHDEYFLALDRYLAENKDTTHD